MNIKNCIYCGNELKSIIEEQKINIDDEIITLKDVPIVKCFNCNEEYITPETIDTINQIFHFLKGIQNII